MVDFECANWNWRIKRWICNCINTIVNSSEQTFFVVLCTFLVHSSFAFYYYRVSRLTQLTARRERKNRNTASSIRHHIEADALFILIFFVFYCCCCWSTPVNSLERIYFFFANANAWAGICHMRQWCVCVCGGSGGHRGIVVLCGLM